MFALKHKRIPIDFEVPEKPEERRIWFYRRFNINEV